MKNHVFLVLMFNIFTISTNSFTMMNKITEILITQKSAKQINQINHDYQTIQNAIQSKSKNLHSYKKPSIFLENFLKDKSIKTNYMSIDMVFLPVDMDFLDAQFEYLSQVQSDASAWNNVISLMNLKLKNTYKYYQNRELINGATSNNLFDKKEFVSFDISKWSIENKENMFKQIQNHKKYLSSQENRA